MGNERLTCMQGEKHIHCLRACSHLVSFLTRKSCFFSQIKSGLFGYKYQPRASFVVITAAVTVA